MPGLLGLLEKVATCNGLRAFEIFLFQGKLWVQRGGLVSYLSARLDAVGVQVKVGSRLAPYPIQELVQADRLHLLLGQLKEPVLRGAEVSPAPEFREISRIREFSENSTEISTEFLCYF